MIKFYQKEEDFNNIIQNRVLIDFYATWCGPCKMLSQEIEKIEKEVDIDIIKVNVDEYEDLARVYGIMSIPTLILFDKGKEVRRNIGFISKEALKRFISD